MRQSREVPIGDSNLIIETGHLAKQAHGSCTVRLGDTVVLATACAENKAGLERDFLPLTVDYREYTAAAGRIPGGFFKREGRPTEKEIITSRLFWMPATKYWSMNAMVAAWIGDPKLSTIGTHGPPPVI